MANVNKPLDITQKTFGFLGCGKISSAMVRGYCSCPIKPTKILVTKRSQEKSQALFNDYPHIVEINDSPEDIVKRSDYIFVGLLPNVARELLPTLNFEGKFVISMMAAVNFDEVIALARINESMCFKIVPLPTVATRQGPIVAFPRKSPGACILSMIGTVVECDTETEMKPIIAITGHISAFFELMNTSQSFLLSKGISEQTAHDYVAAFYAGLAQSATASPSSFHELAVEAATPGGLNEQSVNFIKGTEHYSVFTQSLEAINTRLHK